MFALADKLGYMYMSDSRKHNDPHIPVIRSHREKLTELLEKMAAKKESKLPVSQVDDEEPSVSSDEMPASKEPPSLSDTKKIGYEVAVAISDLGPDAIRRILSHLTFSDTLGYAVGIELDYSQRDEHMKYLENADPDELKGILQRTLESKKTPDDSIDNNRAPSGGGQEAGNSNGGQRQGGESDKISKETGEPKKLLLPQNDDDTQKSQKQTLLPTVEPPTKEEDDDLQVTKTRAKPEPEAGMDGANRAEGVSSNAGGPGHDDNNQANKVAGEKMKEKTHQNEENSKGEDDDPKTSPDDIIPDDDYDYGGGGFDSERMRILNSNEFENFLKLKYNELYGQWTMDKADPDKIDSALDEYRESLSVSGGEGDDSKSNKTKAGDGNVTFFSLRRLKKVRLYAK